MYERVEAWLKAAGAPYATDQLDILSVDRGEFVRLGPAQLEQQLCLLVSQGPPGLHQQRDAQR